MGIVAILSYNVVHYRRFHALRATALNIKAPGTMLVHYLVGNDFRTEAITSIGGWRVVYSYNHVLLDRFLGQIDNLNFIETETRGAEHEYMYIPPPRQLRF